MGEPGHELKSHDPSRQDFCLGQNMHFQSREIVEIVELLFYPVPVVSNNLEAERLLPYLQTLCAFQGLRVGVFPLGEINSQCLSTPPALDFDAGLRYLRPSS